MILTKTAYEIWLAFSLWVGTYCRDPRAQHSIHCDQEIDPHRMCKISPYRFIDLIKAINSINLTKVLYIE